MTSFLIACYNKEKFIFRCVESCLNQSVDEIEVCLVDDGSTDNSWKILNDNFKNHPKVKLHRFPNNQGKVKAYNKAFEIAEGNYFALVGADDYNHPDRIKNSLQRILDNNENYCYGNLVQIDLITGVKSKFQGIKKIKNQNFLRSNIISGGSLTFDSKIAETAFPIPIKLKYEDWYLSIIAIKFFRGRFIDSIMGFYQITGDNENIFSTSLDLEKMLKNRVKIISRDFDVLDIISTKFKDSFNSKELKSLQMSYDYRKMLLEFSFIKRINFFKHLNFLIEPKTIIIFILGLKSFLHIKNMLAKTKTILKN